MNVLSNITFRLTLNDGPFGVQCLRYYYYFANDTGDQKITVSITTKGHEANRTIDEVTKTKYNGWMFHNKTFEAEQNDYEIYFNLKAPSGGVSFYIALDEISIVTGSCGYIAEDTIIPPSLVRTTTSPDTSTTTAKRSTGVPLKEVLPHLHMPQHHQ
ncbi:unnamed protein product [Didymodactylos carnosus]|uniref:MAM domain-containing protein n=1 Tax=Didymodactylos carnosus TaxID=1234261 RepID=A0A815EB63_9BILA|nr:unnamed protein product [Didymodactylos carnosus]CAF1312313.1 unnamed protein product [Didymodactylos carnosus]CAF3633737.1 unnamed protein product [Didymodactylos carnosus]CAF4151001.1 unnamed protein product [Didymodactylos carnosus]